MKKRDCIWIAKDDSCEFGGIKTARDCKDCLEYETAEEQEKKERTKRGEELFNRVIVLPDWKQKAIFSYFWGLMKPDFTIFHLECIEETIKIYEDGKK